MKKKTLILLYFFEIVFSYFIGNEKKMYGSYYKVFPINVCRSRAIRNFFGHQKHTLESR